MTILEMINELQEGLKNGRFKESDILICEYAEDAVIVDSVIRIADKYVRISGYQRV